MAAGTLYYRFIERNNRLEFHFSTVRAEALCCCAMAKAISLASPEIEKWRAEREEEIASLGMQPAAAK